MAEIISSVCWSSVIVFVLIGTPLFFLGRLEYRMAQEAAKFGEGEDE